MSILYVVIFRSINGLGIRYTESTLSREGVSILTSHHVERVENVRYFFLNDDIQLIDHVSHRARCSLQNKAKVRPPVFSYSNISSESQCRLVFLSGALD